MNPMDTAPRDGSRILINAKVWHYDRRRNRYVEAGEQWVDCWFVDGKFIEWCGNPRTRSTSAIDPIGWAPLPEADK